MDKPFHEMTSSERTAYRIAKNRESEQNAFSGNAGMSLDGIVARLDEHKQRAIFRSTIRPLVQDRKTH